MTASVIGRFEPATEFFLSPLITRVSGFADFRPEIAFASLAELCDFLVPCFLTSCRIQRLSGRESPSSALTNNQQLGGESHIDREWKLNLRKARRKGERASQARVVLPVGRICSSLAVGVVFHCTEATTAQ